MAARFPWGKQPEFPMRFYWDKKCDQIKSSMWFKLQFTLFVTVCTRSLIRVSRPPWISSESILPPWYDRRGWLGVNKHWISVYLLYEFLAIYWYDLQQQNSTGNKMPRGRHVVIKRYRCQCTNSWQNTRCLWSPFLLKLFCLLLWAHRELWSRFRSKLKRDLQRLLFMWHCMEPCLSSWRTEGGAGAAAGAGAAEPMGAVESHIRGNLFATNTPRRENNLLIFIVGINCTDRRMHARLFFFKSNIMQLRVSFQFIIGLEAMI